MNKIFIVGVLVMIVCAAGIVVERVNERQEDNQIKEYQGPVPFGYDLKHFRKTGETIKLQGVKE